MKQKIAAAFIYAVSLMTFDAQAQYLSDGYLPHIANGSFAERSFRTTLLLLNYTNNGEAPGRRLTGDGGNPFVVTIPGLAGQNTEEFIIL